MYVFRLLNTAPGAWLYIKGVCTDYNYRTNPYLIHKTFSIVLESSSISRIASELITTHISKDITYSIIVRRGHRVLPICSPPSENLIWLVT
jgi:hypothetical protein